MMIYATMPLGTGATPTPIHALAAIGSRGPSNLPKPLRRYAAKLGLFVQDVQTQVTVQGEPRQEVAIVFARRDLLDTLKARGYLTMMDSTHQTNHLDWKLFTLTVCDGYGTWVPCAHFLSKYEDHDIVARCLDVVIEASDGWHPRYFMTDDSVAEQLAVKKCFDAHRP